MSRPGTLIVNPHSALLPTLPGVALPWMEGGRPISAPPRQCSDRLVSCRTEDREFLMFQSGQACLASRIRSRGERFVATAHVLLRPAYRSWRFNLLEGYAFETLGHHRVCHNSSVHSSSADPDVAIEDAIASERTGRGQQEIVEQNLWPGA